MNGLVKKTGTIKENIKKKDYSKFMKGTYNFRRIEKCQKREKVRVSVFQSRKNSGKMCEVSYKQHHEMMEKYKANPKQLIPTLKNIETLRRDVEGKVD